MGELKPAISLDKFREKKQKCNEVKDACDLILNGSALFNSVHWSGDIRKDMQEILDFMLQDFPDGYHPGRRGR